MQSHMDHIFQQYSLTEPTDLLKGSMHLQWTGLSSQKTQIEKDLRLTRQLLQSEHQQLQQYQQTLQLQHQQQQQLASGLPISSSSSSSVLIDFYNASNSINTNNTNNNNNLLTDTRMRSISPRRDNNIPFTFNNYSNTNITNDNIATNIDSNNSNLHPTTVVINSYPPNTPMLNASTINHNMNNQKKYKY